MLHTKTYPIVTLLIVFFAFLGTLLVLLKPLIPPLPPSELIFEPGEYVQAAARQDIPWYTLSPEAFLLAKRLRKPILLAMGTTGSTAARLADENVFSVRDVIKKLKQDYVCIRVDLFQNPEWSIAFFPITRANIYFDPLFQIWLLKPNGEPFTSVLRTDGGKYLSASTFLNTLISASRQFATLQASFIQETTPELIQQQDLNNILKNKSSSIPNFEGALARIQPQLDETHGGLPLDSIQRVDAYPWIFMAQRGRIDLIKRFFDPVLRSPIVDWLNGGFYRLSNKLDWTQIELDQSAIQNAEIAYLLAGLWCLTMNPFYYQLALRTSHALLTSFYKEGFFYAYRVGDEEATFRSLSSSFNPRILRNNFDPQQREWLRENLGLRVETNPQMLPYVPHPALFLENHSLYDYYFSRLKAIKRSSHTYGGYGLCYVNGTVIARLIETAKLLGNEELLAKICQIFETYRKNFRVGQDEVLPSFSGKSSTHYLGNPLAYADAALQHYLVTGNKEALEDGYLVLKRALFLYTDRVSGKLVQSIRPFQEADYPLPLVPCLVDDRGESLISTAIRILFAYGNIFEKLGSPPPSTPYKNQLLASASALITQYAGIIENCKQQVSSFYSAAYQVMHHPWAYVVGPDATTQAKQIARLRPFHLIIPVVEELRASHTKKTSGIHFVTPNYTGPQRALP